ncbi:MAG TPA: Xaa-Pro peptidase family protein [Anaerolineae bacterium]|nr:Xaa-Pro peptidase family protein [Anaerolineae bacterium]
MTRLDALRGQIEAEGLDAVLISDPINRRYLSGFTGSAGWLLVTAERTLLILDYRYYERAAREAPAWEQVRVATTHEDALFEAARDLGIGHLGVEGDHLTVSQYGRLQEGLPGVTLAPLDKLVLTMRQVKGEGELGKIRAAVRCADQAWAHLCQVIHPGMREDGAAWALESHMRQHGASAVSFPTIVGSGPNGAMPHATAGDRLLREGEPIVIDFGALVDGYCSDITRTICLGTPDEHYLELWHLVLETQAHVEAQLRPGMTAKEADALARDRFVAAGYGDAFGHGLGHGVGLAIHEEPFLSRRGDDTILSPGMVLTVEPGLYLPGWGGVRIEDMVVLREEGAEVLTQAPKEPLVPA